MYFSNHVVIEINEHIGFAIIIATLAFMPVPLY